MTLPGGFRLPLALITERWIEHSVLEQETEIPESQARETALHFLRQQLRSGRVLSGTGKSEPGQDVLLYSGKFQCYEHISIRKNEEIIKPNE